MSTTVNELELLNPGGERIGSPVQGDRRVWIAFAVALTVHASFLIGFLSSPPRIIGDANGAPDAVDVSFVTEAELKSQYAEAMGGPPPAAPAAQPPPPPTQAAPESKPAEAQPEPPVPPTASEQAPPEPAPEPAPQAEAPDKAEAKTEAEKATEQLTAETPDLLALPDPAEKAAAQPAAEPPGEKAAKSETQKASKPAPQKKQKMARREPLDLSMPTPQMDMESATSGGSGAVGVERPPGTTRSGANDQFVRGVIRALRNTMPQLTDIRGRTTVRILLDDKGNLASVTVVAASEVAELTRSVVFSTKQAYFPLPPNGSNQADKTFTITYIYR